MRVVKFGITGLSALAAVMVSSYAVAAGTTTGNVNVSATVATKCMVTQDATVAFGAYDPLQTHAAADLDGSGTLVMRCTKNTAYTIAMDTGVHANAGARRMVNSTDAAMFINYELYTDAGRTAVWNSTTNVITGTATSKNTDISVPVYGRVFQNQDVSDGSYADTVIATISF